MSRTPTRKVVLLCIALAVPLAGCGKKGPLYLPGPTAEQPATPAGAVPERRDGAPVVR